MSIFACFCAFADDQPLKAFCFQAVQECMRVPVSLAPYLINHMFEFHFHQLHNFTSVGTETWWLDFKVKRSKFKVAARLNALLRWRHTCRRFTIEDRLHHCCQFLIRKISFHEFLFCLWLLTIDASIALQDVLKLLVLWQGLRATLRSCLFVHLLDQQCDAGLYCDLNELDFMIRLLYKDSYWP